MIVNAILAGLAGTAAMTILMGVAPRMGLPKMDIMGMLGSMFTTNQGQAKTIGALIHFMMGAVFGIVYALLWGAGIGSPTWLWALIFGAVHTVVVIVVMPVMMRMHPRPPQMEGGAMTLVGQLMGHLVFALVTSLVYISLI